MTHAHTYAAQMVAEVQALDELAGSDLSNGLESLRSDAREMATDLLDCGRLEPEDLQDLDVMGVWLESHALEVYFTGRLTLGESRWTVESVTVLRTCGGPDARISTERDGWVRVDVAWSDHDSRSVHAPALWAYLDSLEDIARYDSQ